MGLVGGFNVALLIHFLNQLIKVLSLLFSKTPITHHPQECLDN